MTFFILTYVVCGFIVGTLFIASDVEDNSIGGQNEAIRVFVFCLFLWWLVMAMCIIFGVVEVVDKYVKWVKKCSSKDNCQNQNQERK